MSHREYTLTVEHPIYETLGPIKVIYKDKGQTVTLSQQDFDRIKKGHDIVRTVVAGHGETSTIWWRSPETVTTITFGKENFANEVTYTEVTISKGVAKLGKRKSK
jgi:hypothetical protein